MSRRFSHALVAPPFHARRTIKHLAGQLPLFPRSAIEALFHETPPPISCDEACPSPKYPNTNPKILDDDHF
jgi:hypothetical protein